MRTEMLRAMTLWRWDDEAKCWRPTLVPPTSPFQVTGCARLISVGRRRWALLAGDAATVNGLPCLPIEILDDRDEVRLASERFCFSTLSPGEAVSFGGDTRKIRCARCLTSLVDGDQIVCCPGCRAHHHETCWTYDRRCQKCEYPTDAAPWVPDPLN